ncbi:Rpn family recombination-promoting nuclease/putative transposase [Methylocucumis oryzae]|nr:Rpn family recombination-promoting nuclease/putative transposase [Methylocucumis oryzae]
MQKTQDQFSADGYRFQSVELKETAFRIDGVFLPPENSDESPLIFAEVQYYQDPKIYARLLSEVMLYLYQNPTRNDWHAVVIFPERSFDPGIPQHYREFFDSRRIDVVYLQQVSSDNGSIGLQLLRLIELAEAAIPSHITRIKNQLDQQTPTIKETWLELLEMMLIYKLPRLSRDEVRIMLTEILNRELQETRFYQEVFSEGVIAGREEGRQQGQQQGLQEGRQEGEYLILSRILTRRFGALPRWAQVRLINASSEQLENWSERLLDAPDLPTLLNDK